MENTFYIFALSFIAGFSTLIGSIIVFFRKKNDKDIVIILGVAIGIIFTLASVELLHHSVEHFGEEINSLLWVILFAIVGYFIMKAIDIFMHHKNNDLNHIGIITTIGLIAHRLPEGILLAIVISADIKLGIALALALVAHHIPEGAVISMPIFYGSNNRVKAIMYSLLASIATMIGALIGYIFIDTMSNEFILGILYAITIGMFIYIIVKELLDTALSYNQNKLLVSSVLLTIAAMNIIHIFIH